MTPDQVLPLLTSLFNERIAFIDGAMGTMIQRYKLEVGVWLKFSHGLLTCNLTWTGEQIRGQCASSSDTYI
jgi:methionine synthase I (cobalamin-dependent)